MTDRTRRQFLARTAAGAAAGITALAAPSVWAAKGDSSKIRDIFKGRRGTTIWLDLETAPFPARGARWSDPTTIVFVPHHYRVRRDYAIDTVVHFHGYRDTAEQSMKRHQLREQLDDSRQNAIIVFPQGPVKANSPDFGKLDAPKGFLRFLTELRKTLQLSRLQAQLGAAGIPNRARIGKVALSAHSGGFRVVSKCLEHGGFPVREVYLFDALYGRAPIFKDWLMATHKRSIPNLERHKLVSYYQGAEDTAAENRRLMRMLDKVAFPFVHEETEGTITRRDMTSSRAVFIRSGTSHQGVLYRTSALRDCLFASNFSRFLKSTWFENKTEPRDLTRRPR